MTALHTPSRADFFNFNTPTRQLKMLSIDLFLCRTIVGVKCRDGVILGAEKLQFSKLLVEGTNPRIFNVYKHIGMAISGKVPDGKHVMSHGRH